MARTKVDATTEGAKPGKVLLILGDRRLTLTADQAALLAVTLRCAERDARAALLDAS